MIDLRIEFRDIVQTPRVEAAIDRWAERLGVVCGTIGRCRVVIGKAPHGVYRPRFAAHVEAFDVASSTSHEHTATHGNVYIALADAFRATLRSVLGHDHARQNPL